jgi:hypothetical protein
MALFEQIVAAYSRMNSTEKQAFLSWEQLYVTGDGRFGSSDWPGWRSVLRRLSH